MTVTAAPPTAPPPPATPAAPAPRTQPATRRAAGLGAGAAVALSLTLAGVLVLGFGLYLFALSGVSESHAQHALLKSFSKSLGEATAPVGPGTEGNPVAVLDIPAIGVHNLVVVEGTSSRDLMSGPGHLPNTVLPGQPGISTVYGKRTTFGSPFRKLLDLQPGDVITAYTGQGANTYKVSSFGDRTHPAPANSTNRLLLVTAYPGWSPNSYVMVSADLTSTVQDAPGGLPGAYAMFTPLARDATGSLIPLTAWCQLLLIVAVLGTVFLVRGVARWPVVVCLSAVVVAVVWNVYENAAGLLPNLF